MLGVAAPQLPAAAKPAEAPLVKSRTQETMHLVKPGESLWRIALRRYGRGSLWPRLYQLNRSLIGPNPSVIRPGMHLHLQASASASPSLANGLKTATPRPEPTSNPAVEPAEPAAAPTAEAPQAPPVPANDPSRQSSLRDREFQVGSAVSPRAAALDLTYLPVATSLVVPGSGQAIQGHWEKGLVHLGVMAVSMMAFKSGIDQGDRSLQILGGAGLLGITLWSPWDAYLGLPQPETSDDVLNP